MKFGVYCIRDIKSTWLSPTVDVSDNVAFRNFAYAINHNDLFSEFASDFEFYKIGEFDSELGLITPIQHVFLCHGGDVVSKSHVLKAGDQIE